MAQSAERMLGIGQVLANRVRLTHRRSFVGMLVWLLFASFVVPVIPCRVRALPDLYIKHSQTNNLCFRAAYLNSRCSKVDNNGVCDPTCMSVGKFEIEDCLNVQTVSEDSFCKAFIIGNTEYNYECKCNTLPLS